MTGETSEPDLVTENGLSFEPIPGYSMPVVRVFLGPQVIYTLSFTADGEPIWPAHKVHPVILKTAWKAWKNRGVDHLDEIDEIDHASDREDWLHDRNR